MGSLHASLTAPRAERLPRRACSAGPRATTAEPVARETHGALDYAPCPRGCQLEKKTKLE